MLSIGLTYKLNYTKTYLQYRYDKHMEYVKKITVQKVEFHLKQCSEMRQFFLQLMKLLQSSLGQIEPPILLENWDYNLHPRIFKSLCLLDPVYYSSVSSFILEECKTNTQWCCQTSWVTGFLYHTIILYQNEIVVQCFTSSW